MNRFIAGFAIWTISLIIFAACGTEEAETPGGIAAQIDCIGQDSLLATVYMTGAETAAASQWCSCAGSDTCSIDFTGLGYGDYVLGIGRPDSTYLATEGAEGFSRTLGYYGDDGLSQDADEATTITLSAEQPRSNVTINFDDERGTTPE